MYEVRLCKSSELSLLKDFLRDSWSPDHIFLKDQKILDFQHKSHDGYNFVVANHCEKKEFHGVLGFISPSHYSNGEILSGDSIWLAIWKVDKDRAESNSLGFDLLNYINDQYCPSSITAIGINRQVSLLYKLIGFQINTMNHWFIPSVSKSERRLIIGNVPSRSEVISSESDYRVEIIDVDSRDIEQLLIQKSGKDDALYIAERYLKHPTYDYNLMGVYDFKNRLIGLIVGREVSAEGSKAFRVTDLWLETDSTFDLAQTIQPFLHSHNYEYIDFLEYGWPSERLESMGLIKNKESLYVPHLFEPFVGEKIDVIIAYKSENEFTCSKGDSDLDRPHIKELMGVN